jgi:hypothetical protein
LELVALVQLVQPLQHWVASPTTLVFLLGAVRQEVRLRQEQRVVTVLVQVVVVPLLQPHLLEEVVPT